jgi:uncharacterized protein (TIGR02996 family)
MPPPGYEPFLRAICENPEDDTVRLVYADWLDENGDPDRAEFIRLQVRRARLREAGTDSEELRARDHEMRRTAATAWLAELPRIRRTNWQRFWRGFVSGIDVNGWVAYNRNADTIFSITPVQFLLIAGLRPAECARFADSPYLRRLSGLTISDRAIQIGSGWHDLAWCPCLSSLRWLTIRGPIRGELIPGPLERVINETAARVLASSPYLHQLQALTIHDFLEAPVADILRERFHDRVRWFREA